MRCNVIMLKYDAMILQYNSGVCSEYEAPSITDSIPDEWQVAQMGLPAGTLWIAFEGLLLSGPLEDGDVAVDSISLMNGECDLAVSGEGVHSK